MKATIAHTSDGRTKVVLQDVSANVETFFSNLGGKKFDGFWIFSKADGQYATECLEDEGYTVTAHELF